MGGNEDILTYYYYYISQMLKIPSEQFWLFIIGFDDLYNTYATFYHVSIGNNHLDVKQ